VRVEEINESPDVGRGFVKVLQRLF
jgi:hypothetical protein